MIRRRLFAIMPYGVRLVTARSTLTQRNGLTLQRWRSRSIASFLDLPRPNTDGRVRLSNEWAPSGGIAASENEGMPQNTVLASMMRLETIVTPCRCTFKIDPCWVSATGNDPPCICAQSGGSRYNSLTPAFSTSYLSD